MYFFKNVSHRCSPPLGGASATGGSKDHEMERPCAILLAMADQRGTDLYQNLLEKNLEGVHVTPYSTLAKGCVTA